MAAVNDALAQLGSRIRRLREDRSLSALALARAAGLSMNVVRNVERGLRRPQVATVKKLASALELPKRDREDLVRLAGLSRVPAEARAATAVPGVEVWRFLPALLFDDRLMERGVAEFVPTDELLPDVVTTLASVLGAVALHRGMLSGKRLSAMRRVRDDLLAGLAGDSESPRDGTFHHSDLVATRARLVMDWRSCLFGDEKTARALARLLAHWNFQRIGYDQVGQMQFWFRNRELDQNFGAPLDLVPRLRRVHDFFAAQYLWYALELGGTSPPLISLRRDQLHRAPPDARVVGRTLRAARRAIRRDGPPGNVRPGPRSPSLSELDQQLALIARLYLLPPGARREILPSKSQFRGMRRRLAAMLERESANMAERMEKLRPLQKRDRPPPPAPQ